MVHPDRLVHLDHRAGGGQPGRPTGLPRTEHSRRPADQGRNARVRRRRRNPAAMARTDDDSWDITEGVGATALGVAMARAEEATSRTARCSPTPTRSCSSTRPSQRGWRLPPPHMVERIRIDREATPRRAPSGSTSSSSRQAQTASSRRSSSPQGWTPGRGGCRGCDGSVVYEIDQPKVLAVQGRDAARHTA